MPEKHGGVLYIQVPKITPTTFPVTVSHADILNCMDDHPACGAIPISESVFDVLWRRAKRMSNLMKLKLLVIAPYMAQEVVCNSLPSYWLCRKLSHRIVGLGKDHELNQMISKGTVWFLQEIDVALYVSWLF